MTPVQIKVLIGVLLIIGSFATGWSVKGAYVAKEELAIAEAKNELINAFRAMEGNVAGVVEDKLAGLKANERVINNEIVNVNYTDADFGKLIERFFQYQQSINKKYVDILRARKELNDLKNMNDTFEKSVARLKKIFQDNSFYK